MSTTSDIRGAYRALVITAAQRNPNTDLARLVLFLPGFLTSPNSYRALLSLVAQEGTMVVAPRIYRPSPAMLAGRLTPSDEAVQAIDVVDHLVAAYGPTELWLAGHSRGGQVAWLLAKRVSAAGVIAIDPVDGSGRNPTELSAAAQPAGFAARTLVIGAGRGGRCAPAAVNHEHFAKAGPPGVAHVVIPSMGHGDIFDDRRVRAARMLRGGSEHPARDRTTVGVIISRFFGGTLPTVDETPVKIVVR